MAVILDARGLSKSFGAISAAGNISVAIEKDSVVGLIGTNGAGKTTFINMITGYLKPDSGSIRYEGRDITALAPRQIAQLGICRSFQIPQLYSSLSVYENMLTGLGIMLHNSGRGGFFSFDRPNVPGHDAPAEEVADRILGRFGLAAYRDRNAQVLPGGVRKLLDIALTMAARPRLRIKRMGHKASACVITPAVPAPWAVFFGGTLARSIWIRSAAPVSPAMLLRFWRFTKRTPRKRQICRRRWIGI